MDLTDEQVEAWKQAFELAGVDLDALGEFEALEGELKKLNLPTAWDRKKQREKRRAVERATASRFRQYKASERNWSARKRTSPRRREWRGAWKEN